MLRMPSARISIIVHLLLFSIVAASTLNYWSVANYALNGNWDPYYFQKQTYIGLVPGLVKVLKDIFAFLLLFTSLWFPSTTPKVGLKENRGLIICYALCLISLAIAIVRCIASDFSITLVFTCLRPFVATVAVFVFCHRHLHPYYMRWVLEAINPLALMQVYYAFLQRQAGVNQNGIAWLSSGAARSVGTFIGPNTLGLFLALAFYINLSVLPPHKLRFLILSLCPVGIFFSGSRTALLIVLLLMSFKFYQSICKVFVILKDKLLITFFGIPLFLVVSTSALSRVNELSNRSSSASGDGRIDILKHYFYQTDTFSLLFGKYLGFGSNLVLTLNKNAGVANDASFLADSTLTSLLTQFGIIGVVIVISIIVIIITHKSNQINNLQINYINPCLKIEKIDFLVYFINTASTIILFEFYACLPIIIAILFLLRQPKVINKTSTDFNFNYTYKERII